jgi:hypothetical protein
MGAEGIKVAALNGKLHFLKIVYLREDLEINVICGVLEMSVG